MIELKAVGKLSDYYNQEVSCLEHFKYPKLFFRRTKNCYISFVPKALIEEICSSQPVSYNAILCRVRRKNTTLKFKDLRSNHNSYLRKNGIISELVEILAGRVPKSVFCRHYLGESMKPFKYSGSKDREKLGEIFDSIKLKIFFRKF